MRLEDYPRPKDDNRRGIHWSASVYHPTGAALDFWIGELQAMKIKWVKIMDDGGGSSLELCQRLLAVDIMPIVRFYRLEPNPGHIGGREEDTLRTLVAAGVRYFETNNEPDLAAEWKGGRMPSNWFDIVIDNFIIDADKVLAAGGLPALPAMGVGSRSDPVGTVVAKGRADIFERGAWVAIHNYAINHPLDYPYDPVNQEGQPVSQEEYNRLGPWAWDRLPRELINQWRESDKNPGDTLADDAVSWFAFVLADQLAAKALGYHVPIISTEGGVVTGWKEDRRYARIDPNTHADWTIAITEFMQGTREIHGLHCPDYYFAVCHWLIANYRAGFLMPTWESQSWYTDWWNNDFNLKGEMPVVARLKALPSVSIDQTRKAVVAGRVTRSDTDEPLAGLTVKLSAQGRDVANSLTGADGLFRFERLAAGIYDLSIAPWGMVRQGVTAAEEPVQSVTIRLTGGSSSVLTGTVQTSAAAPVVGVSVTLRRDNSDVGSAATDANGAFRFEGLPLGTYRLSVPRITVAGINLDGWQTKSLRLTSGAAPGQRYIVARRRLLPVDETAGRRILYGTVVDAAGSPLRHIKLEMRWQGAASGTVFPTTLSGQDSSKPAGAYEFLSSRGVFSLRVIQGDWPSDVADGLDTATVPGREGQPIAYEVDFRLQAVGGPAQVDGSVPGGQAGAQLTLEAATGDDPAPRSAALAADGSFVFSDVVPGNYRLRMVDIGILAEDIAVEPGSLFKLLFPMGSRLAGQVLAPSDGLVAALHAPAAWGWTRLAPVDSQGAFAFENLPSGRYRLEVGAQTIPDLVLTGENQLQLAAIDLTQGYRSVVRGRVANGAGQPQPEVQMILRRDGVTVAQASTLPDGAFSIASLPAGVYTLEAVGLGQVADSIVLDGEREQIVDVLWPDVGPRSALQGRVLDAHGSPVAEALVRLLRDDAEVARMQTDDLGAFRFSGLYGGLYALAVGEDAPLVTDIALDEDATMTRDVTLPPDTTKLLAHYLLLGAPPEPGQPGHFEARLVLGLVSHHMARAGASCGYSVAEAGQAVRVTIIGDQVSAADEQTLRAAGCQVTRLGGDGYALAAALESLFAEG